MTGERQLIKKIKEWTGGAGGADGNDKMGDDCAVLARQGLAGQDLPGQWLVSADMLVEGRHFSLAYTDFESLGWKSCAVNLSDVAAMAGRPRYLTVCLSLPSYISEDNLQSFYQGFNQCARDYGAEVVGGDLSGGDSFVIAVTVLGEAHEKGVLKRSGARVGDIVLVTGNFGASALGLRLLAAAEKEKVPGSHPAAQSNLAAERKAAAQCDKAISAHRRPLPRLCEAFALVRQVGSRGALIDCSDGLVDGLFQISEASAVSMKVNVEQIPIDPEVRAAAAALGLDPLDLALYGGEDYELVATASPGSIDFLEDHFPFVPIGLVVAQEELGQAKVELVQATEAGQKGRTFVDLSNCYQHFW